jgi:hypothetical protein
VSRVLTKSLRATIGPAGIFAYHDQANSCGAYGTATQIGGENCYLVVTYANDGRSSLTFSPVDLDMVDQHGTKYGVASVIPACYDSVQINAPYTLQPNTTLTVQLCYPVQTGALPNALAGVYSLNGINFPVDSSSVQSLWGGM